MGRLFHRMHIHYRTADWILLYTGWWSVCLLPAVPTTLTAAAPACATVSGISFGPWHTPERKTPAVGDSTGRSFACASVKKSLVSILAVSMVASFPLHLCSLDGSCKDNKVCFHFDLTVVKQVGTLYQKTSRSEPRILFLPGL